MAKKDISGEYLVQAYQSSHTQQLFAVEKKAEFEKHLRAVERAQRSQLKTAKETQERLDFWIALRCKTTCIEDVSTLLNDLPLAAKAYYQENGFFHEVNGKKGWHFTPEKEMFLKATSISHRSPLNQHTNWCARDKERPSHVLGLSGTAEQNLNCDIW